MTAATNLYAEAILADPANRRLRETMRTLEWSERIVQLCNIEGLEQIRLAEAGTMPDALISYAFAEPTLTGTTLEAEGGAFRSDRRWYAVRFSCTVSAELDRVTEFRFAVGDPIPEEEWATHDLIAVDGVE
ncbi:MAG: DUF930 domain-containing protein [Bauldia sp.]